MFKISKQNIPIRRLNRRIKASIKTNRNIQEKREYRCNIYARHVRINGLPKQENICN